jgi:uncharacterized membrane protein
MTLLLIGLLLFLGVHSVSIVAPRWRDAMAARIGEQPWKGVYTLFAVVGFVLIVKGYAAARLDPTVLYAPAPWLRHVAFALLLPVFPLLLATYLPGRVKRAAKHPTLLATKFWALAHLLANGMLADVVLFGAFLAWAVADRISLTRRPARAVPALPGSRANDAIVIVGGLALYAAFALWLHPLLIGVPVIAR